MPQYLFVTLLVIFIFSCKNTSPEETNANLPSTDTPAQAPPPNSSTPIEFIVNIDNIRLRAAPGPEGKEIAQLPKGTVLIDQNEMSDFTSKIKLRGIQFDEPWLKVKTKEELTGWIYAGGVHFHLNDDNKKARLLMQRRLKVLFGEVADEILNYQQSYTQVQSTQDFITNYRKGNQLRDTLVQLLETRIPVDHDQLPDLFWLKEAMPAYQPALVAEGTLYYLFKDFKTLKEKASQTDGKEDDAFCDLMLAVHAMDSVEYFFPSWFLQTWDYGGYSMLGQGIHFDILTKIEGLKNQNNPFKDEYIEIKDELLNDMTNQYVEYGEGSVKIINEIKRILSANFSVLTTNDVVELKARIKQFENPDKHNIKVNLKAGI